MKKYILEVKLISGKNIHPKQSNSELFIQIQVHRTKIVTKRVKCIENPLFHEDHTITFHSNNPTDEKLDIKVFVDNKSSTGTAGMMSKKEIGYLKVDLNNLLRCIPLVYRNCRLKGEFAEMNQSCLSFSIVADNFGGSDQSGKIVSSVRKSFGKYIVTVYHFLEQSIKLKERDSSDHKTNLFIEKTKSLLDPMMFLVKQKRVKEEDLIYITKELEIFKDCVKRGGYDDVKRGKTELNSKICEEILINCTKNPILFDIYSRFKLFMIDGDDEIENKKQIRIEGKRDKGAKNKLSNFLRFFKQKKGSIQKSNKKEYKKMRLDQIDCLVEQTLKSFQNENYEISSKNSRQTHYYDYIKKTFANNPVFKDAFKIKYEDLKLTSQINHLGSNPGIMFCGEYMGNQITFTTLLANNVAEEDFVDFVRKLGVYLFLEHPHIQKFHGMILSKDDQIGLVHEFCPYGSIDIFLIENPNTSIYDRVKFLYEICTALLYLHRQIPRIIHRDLNPKNVLIDNNIQAKLTGFGVSQMLRIGKNFLPTNVLNIGESESYQAPELLSYGHHYNELCDVYSFGILAYEVLTSDFTKKDLSLDAHVRYDLNRIKSKEWIKKLISKCFSKKPESRPSAEIIYETFLLNMAFEKDIIIYIRSMDQDDDEAIDFTLYDFTLNGLTTLIKKLFMKNERKREIWNIYLKDDDEKLELITTDEHVRELSQSSLVVVEFKLRPIVIYVKTPSMLDEEADDVVIKDYTMNEIQEKFWKSAEDWWKKRKSQWKIVEIYIERRGSKVNLTNDKDLKQLQSDDIVVFNLKKNKKKLPKKGRVLYVRTPEQKEEDACDIFLRDFSYNGLIKLIKHELGIKDEIENIFLEDKKETKLIEKDVDVKHLSKDSMIIVVLREKERVV